MWLTKLWWLFDFIISFARFRFLSFLFGEVLFFAKLLDVYSYYVFDTPTLFACLVTSVDEELRCFFNCCLWWQGNSLTLLTQVHIPAQSIKWRLRGKKKLNGFVFFVRLTAQSSTCWQICICRFCCDLMDKRQFIPFILFKGFLGCGFFFFLILFDVIHVFNVLVMLFDQTHFLCVRFSSETYYCLFCTELSLDISKQLRGFRPSPAAHQNTALLSCCK